MEVALITGCSGGIGRALALEMNRQGYVVYATSRNRESMADLAVRGIKTEQLDVTDGENIQRVIQQIISEEEKIDVLVNNAGYGLFGPLMDVPIAELRAQFDTNLFGVLSLIQQVVPAMRPAGGGTIVNIGSVSGVLPTPFAGAYCASKAALHALSDVLRMELAPFNIRVLTVQPGAIQSRFGENAGKNVQRLVTENSLYHQIKDAIRARAQMSQTNATPAEEFAGKLVKRIRKKTTGNPVIRIGKKSVYLPFLKRWVPEPWLDKILSRKFQLDRLGTGRSPR